MPIYDYRCDKCQMVIEVMSSGVSREMRRHAIDGGTLRRIFSAPSIVYKGAGWAKKDRKDGGKA